MERRKHEDSILFVCGIYTTTTSNNNSDNIICNMCSLFSERYKVILEDLSPHISIIINRIEKKIAEWSTPQQNLQL